MDMSLVMAAMAMQQGNLQGKIATSVMKQNLDSQAEAAQVLLGAQLNAGSQANLAAGIGGNVDISA
ncbi:putative motility protein [Bradyrhizobium prioriisuperbiae]|uniref:putative motility protein n=1 Tax=Bradyrhizobium prioriisuperbiae TaxID=2854389 RepID=UPI0028EA4765|nr:putative motility protein [Bradyrhizobium prioritasuperba]